MYFSNDGCLIKTSTLVTEIIRTTDCQKAREIITHGVILAITAGLFGTYLNHHFQHFA